MTYKILPYSYQKAKELDVEIKESEKKNKKIDVYKNGKYICSIGDDRYLDYPYYIKQYGKEYADKRRELYKIRHERYRNIVGTPSYWADKILW